MNPGLRTVLSWLAAGMVLLLVLYLLGGILLPFLVGMAAAYVLDPVADRLQRAGLGRTAATLTLTVLFFAALVPLMLLLLPVLVEQVVDLATRLPDYLEALRGRFVHVLEALNRQDLVQELSMQGLVTRFSERALGFLGTAIGNVVQSSLAVLNLLSLLFVTPIVTFYLLRDWDRMVAAVARVVPPRYLPLARRLAAEVDEVLAGFLRGQGLICLFLATFYALGLTLVGLQHGTIIGLLTGLFSFIPYVGMLAGVAVGLTVAAFQFGSLWPMALVAGVFALGQFIEGNFLTPRVVGKRIRLHPVWVIFAVLAGTALFGLAGTFFATPVAAVIAVLVRFGVERWRSSRYFADAGDEPAKLSEPAWIVPGSTSSEVGPARRGRS
ncbi:AI-2E family transporter [Benzoatithermus flavus]|uniref:AI-2E family transporter n=1 Tax=Benzoatithermus flavus TaxID=3108223 RepID=A0ABU8XS49_9PROT